MIEKRDYPVALAADPKSPTLALTTAMAWVLLQHEHVGGQVLVYAPGKQNIAQNETLAAFCHRSDVAVATWRQRSPAWYGGPVLAAWPSREKLGDIAILGKIRALCVVPWAEGEVDAWAAAASPELLRGAALSDVPPVHDPVVVEGLKTLTAMVNHGNHLAGALDRRDAVAVLSALYRGGYRLEPDAVYAWALANGWAGRGAERLAEMAQKIGSGHRMRSNRPSPLREDILDLWRADAAQVSDGTTG